MTDLAKTFPLFLLIMGFLFYVLTANNIIANEYKIYIIIAIIFSPIFYFYCNNINGGKN